MPTTYMYIYVFFQIVSCVVDPLVNAINESASGLGAIESAVYLLNCFHQLHSTLSLLHTTGEKLEMIQVLIYSYLLLSSLLLMI